MTLSWPDSTSFSKKGFCIFDYLMIITRMTDYTHSNVPHEICTTINISYRADNIVTTRLDSCDNCFTCSGILWTCNTRNPVSMHGGRARHMKDTLSSPDGIRLTAWAHQLAFFASVDNAGPPACMGTRSTPRN